MSRFFMGFLVVANLLLTGVVLKDQLPPLSIISQPQTEPDKPAQKKVVEPAAPKKIVVPAKPRPTLDSVTSFAYYTSQVDPEKVLASNHKMFIINEADSNSRLFEKSDVEHMKSNGKLIVAEISLGVAENYRWYWDKDWNGNKPAFIGEELEKNKFFIKKLQSPEWWKISTSIIDKAIDSGYDGILMDGMDAWIEMGAAKSMRDETIDYVIALSKYAKNKKADFLIFTKNAEQLGVVPQFADAVDAIVKEALVYSAEGPKNPNEQIVKSVRDLKSLGKPVYVIEYVAGAAWTDAKSRIRTNGFMGYSAPNSSPNTIRENVW
jgi:cysteinyl-tRNA synthetase